MSRAAEVYAEHFAKGREVARSLPKDIQEMLARKSSKDPSTRFSRKLHALLSYVDANPEISRDIGVMWHDDNVFMIHKARLLGVMGLKINSLNVNLHSQGFVQLHEDRVGWTRWRRDGFTRREYQITTRRVPMQPAGFDQPPELFPVAQDVEPDDDHAPRKPNPRLARLEVADCEPIQRQIVEEWMSLTESPDIMLNVASSFLISKAAYRYRRPEQSYDNAFDVLRAIIVPQDDPNVQFWDFFRFMCEFGPPETAMLKIHSLLETATTDGYSWLYFGLLPGKDFNLPWASFDDLDANGLLIRDGRGGTKWVWNLPLVPFGEDFIVDANDRKYASWQAFFQEEPMKPE
jgi:hypothetical protein